VNSDLFLFEVFFLSQIEAHCQEQLEFDRR
jgi:hypothetical protein